MKNKINRITTHDQDDYLLFEKAEQQAEQAICNKGCLCPALKEIGQCCGCEVFIALRDYYIAQETEKDE